MAYCRSCTRPGHWRSKLFYGRRGERAGTAGPRVHARGPLARHTSWTFMGAPPECGPWLFDDSSMKQSGPRSARQDGRRDITEGRQMTYANFGHAWLAMSITLGLHVADEAAHDFLAWYKSARAGATCVRGQTMASASRICSELYQHRQRSAAPGRYGPGAPARARSAFSAGPSCERALAALRNAAFRRRLTSTGR